MTILGIDVSHHQGAINWSQVRASGRDFCVLKATEGTGYTDPTLATNRRNAHAAGLIVGLYHFARLGSPAAEAAYFARTVGRLQPGEFVVLDYEPNPVPPGSAAWSKQWLDAVRNLLGVAPLVYMNSYTMAVDNWSAVAKDYGLWLAKYDNSTAATPTKWWPTEAMKQHYDKGTVPGIAGPCDVDVFFGTRDQLLKYGKGGTPTPPPPPPPVHQEDDMRLLRSNETGGVWLLGEFSMQPVPDQATYQMYQDAGVPAAGVPQSTLDALAAQTDARRKKLLDDMQGWILGGKPAEADKPWLWDRIKQTSDALAKAQSGGVDPVEVATLVLAGIKAQMSADVTTPPPA